MRNERDERTKFFGVNQKCKAKKIEVSFKLVRIFHNLSMGNLFSRESNQPTEEDIKRLESVQNDLVKLRKDVEEDTRKLRNLSKTGRYE